MLSTTLAARCGVGRLKLSREQGVHTEYDCFRMHREPQYGYFLTSRGFIELIAFLG